jgi:hypothetical protein
MVSVLWDLREFDVEGYPLIGDKMTRIFISRKTKSTLLTQIQLLRLNQCLNVTNEKSRHFIVD